MYIFHGIGPRQAAPHPEFHIFTCVQACSAAAAEGLFPDGIFRHFMELIAYIINDISRFLKKPHASCRIAGVMVGDDKIVISARIKLQFVVLYQVSSEFGDMDHLG